MIELEQIILLKNIQKNDITLNLSKKYDVNEIKSIFDFENGLMFFEDMEEEKIMIKDKDDLYYFLDNLKNRKNIKINNYKYKIYLDEFIILEEDDFIELKCKKKLSEPFIKINEENYYNNLNEEKTLKFNKLYEQCKNIDFKKILNCFKLNIDKSIEELKELINN